MVFIVILHATAVRPDHQAACCSMSEPYIFLGHSTPAFSTQANVRWTRGEPDKPSRTCRRSGPANGSTLRPGPSPSLDALHVQSKLIRIAQSVILSARSGIKG